MVYLQLLDKLVYTHLSKVETSIAIYILRDQPEMVKFVLERHNHIVLYEQIAFHAAIHKHDEASIQLYLDLAQQLGPATHNRYLRLLMDAEQMRDFAYQTLSRLCLSAFQQPQNFHNLESRVLVSQEPASNLYTMQHYRTALVPFEALSLSFESCTDAQGYQLAFLKKSTDSPKTNSKSISKALSSDRTEPSWWQLCWTYFCGSQSKIDVNSSHGIELQTHEVLYNTDVKDKDKEKDKNLIALESSNPEDADHTESSTATSHIRLSHAYFLPLEGDYDLFKFVDDSPDVTVFQNLSVRVLVDQLYFRLYKYFIQRLCLYLLYFLLTLLHVQVFAFGYLLSSKDALSVGAQLAIHGAMLLPLLLPVYTEWQEFREETAEGEGGANSAHAYFKNPWNLIDISTILALLGWYSIHLAATAHYGAGVFWSGDLDLLVGLRTFGILLYVCLLASTFKLWRIFGSTSNLIATLVQNVFDIQAFLVLLATVVVFSALIMQATFAKPGDCTSSASASGSSGSRFCRGSDSWAESDTVERFESAYNALLGALYMASGDFGLGYLEDAYFWWLAVLLLVLFVILVFVIMMNTLIAILADSYERIQENKELYSYQQRLSICLEMLHSFSLAERLRLCAMPKVVLISNAEISEDYANTPEVDTELAGMTNKILHKIAPKFDKLEVKFDKLESNNQEVKAKFDKLESSNQEIKASNQEFKAKNWMETLTKLRIF